MQYQRRVPQGLPVHEALAGADEDAPALKGGDPRARLWNRLSKGRPSLALDDLPTPGGLRGVNQENLLHL